MRFFALTGMLIGIVPMLVSCSANLLEKPKAPKVFQYVFQDPARTPSNPQFSRQLAQGEEGSHALVRLENQQVVKARLGKHYHSASGYACRRYLVNGRDEYVSCMINGHWQDARPVIISAVARP